MKHTWPKPLTKNKHVAVVAPAGVVESSSLYAGLAVLEEPFSVLISSQILVDEGYLAGSDGHRLAAFQSAIDDADVGAIVAARGGFGTTRIIDDIVWDKMVETPKWLVGSSDLTALLVHLWDCYRLITIHGPMVAGFSKTRNTDVSCLFEMLRTTQSQMKESLIPLSPGVATGPLIGGNLTILAHLMGGVDVGCFKGAILFLEDVAERPYRLERALIQLLRAGVLSQIEGVILGEFTHCNAPPSNTTSATEALLRVLGPLKIPVAAGFPAAHGGRNRPFYHGAMVTLSVLTDSAAVSY